MGKIPFYHGQFPKFIKNIIIIIILIIITITIIIIMISCS
jgi:hypothetical protein